MNKMILIGIAAVVVCIVVGLIIYFATKTDEKPKTNEKPKTPSPGPGSSPPAVALKAKFYEHCDYQGGVSELGVGDYNINAMGIANDIISSVRVPSGLKVILYEHGDFQGKTVELTSDAPCLVNQGFNDVVSGIKVVRI
jgi:hypothetical protein